jgi:tetratricopeptide (TPR) repeat protein
LVAARQDNKDKKYADAATLMLQVTSTRPDLIYPWIELGAAQLGLKKYTEAENSFKVALGIDSASQQKVHSSDFYQGADAPPGVVAPTATHSSRNVAGGGTVVNQPRNPEILGMGYSSLGEVYIHEKKVPEAKDAFDKAVKANPAQAALFRHNEAVFFFQIGDAPNQLEAANQAIAADPARAANYYFKGQALVGQATIDPKTNKLVLPDGCAEAYQKYLELEPNGQFAADAKGVLASTGLPLKGKK